MLSRATYWALLVPMVGLGCRCPGPKAKATCDPPSTCPEGSRLDARGDCVAHEPVSIEKISVGPICTEGRVALVRREDVKPAEAQSLFDEAAASGLVFDCKQKEILLPFGIYRAIHRRDDAGALSVGAVHYVMPGADESTTSRRRGDTLFAPELLSAWDAPPIADAPSTAVRFFRIDPKRTELEWRVVGLDEQSWYFDQIAIEIDGRRVIPSGGNTSVLSTVDGRGVLVRPGTGVRLRFTLPPTHGEWVSVVVHGHRVSPNGSLPKPLPTCAIADVCPLGSKPQDGGCVAHEPLVRESDPKVRVELECRATHCCFFSARGASLTNPPDVAAEVKRRSALGEVTWCGTGKTTLELIAGPYWVTGTSTYGTEQGVRWIEPRTSPKLSISGASSTCCHCPTVGLFDPVARDFGEPFEILRHHIGSASQATDLSSRTVIAKDGVIELRIGEMQPETAYIDQLVLEWKGKQLMPTEGGAASVLAKVDGRVLRMDENRQVQLRFELPERINGPTEVRLVANGYYLRHDGS